MRYKRSKTPAQFLTRRQMLNIMGKSCAIPMLFDPMQALLGSLADGIVRKAQASAAPLAVGPRNHVFLYMYAGPPRWYFDLALNPYGNGPDAVPNNSVVNGFANDGSSNAGVAQYATYQLKRSQIRMPYLWSCNIPTSDGSSVPMENLMDNMLIMRGVDMLADGHPSNAVRQLRPVPSEPSLNGAVADGSARIMPAVEASPQSLSSLKQSMYHSGTGVGLASANVVQGPSNGNSLQDLYSPFNRNQDNLPSMYMSRRGAMSDAVNQVLAKLAAYSSSAQPGSETLFDLRNRAESMIQKGIGDAVSAYSSLYNKYNQLILRSALMPIAGVTDKPVVSSNYAFGANCGSGSDFNNTLSGDLRQLLAPNIYIDGLAGGMAVAEYLLTQGHSSAISLCAGYIYNIPTAYGSWVLDQHFCGAAPATVMDSFYYRAIAACLYEFTAVLKNANLFEETVIQLGSEFSRSPRNDASGADHGYKANVVTLLSGAINQPMVLGNTYIDASQVFGAGYPGGWGHAAPVNVEGSELNLNIGYASSTVAQLLRVAPPAKNNISLVTENQNGGISANIELAQNKVYNG